MTLQCSTSTVAEVDQLRQTNDPTRFTQIYQRVLQDIRSQYGGEQFPKSDVLPLSMLV